MDEVHFLADRFRGAVWEEVIIHLPQAVRLVSLSATVSNAEEFGDWLQAVRGRTRVIVSEERPVPLEQHVLMRTKLVDLFDATQQRLRRHPAGEPRAASRWPGTAAARVSSRQMQDVGRRHSKGGAPRGFAHAAQRRSPGMLGDLNLLPAIFFVFSRAGCDAAVRQAMRDGVRLTEAWERQEIREIVEERCRTLLDEDLAVLGYWQWLEGLERGVAAHHAGLLPAFKEVVEELFQRKLVKVVFATETLALGHQHAGPHGRAREAREVQRREPACRSRRGSTRSSPAGQGAAASTSRATASSAGRRGSTRRRSPRSPPAAPTR